jgi:enoyl reductase-like protein
MTAIAEQVTHTKETILRLSRQELVALGSSLNIPSVANMSSADLRTKILELNGTPDETKDIKAQEAAEAAEKKAKILDQPEIVEAKRIYDEALARVKSSIEANQVAMAAYKADSTPETKAAYTATKAEHKAAIAHIKIVRPAYKELRDKALAAAD